MEKIHQDIIVKAIKEEFTFFSFLFFFFFFLSFFFFKGTYRVIVPYRSYLQFRRPLYKHIHIHIHMYLLLLRFSYIKKTAPMSYIHPHHKTPTPTTHTPPFKSPKHQLRRRQEIIGSRCHDPCPRSLSNFTHSLALSLARVVCAGGS